MPFQILDVGSESCSAKRLLANSCLKDAETNAWGPFLYDKLCPKMIMYIVPFKLFQ